MQWILCLFILLIAGWSISQDLRSGKVRVGTKGWRTPRGQRASMLKQREYPLIFGTLIVVKVLVTIFLILIISGQFMPLIQNF